MYNDLAYAPFGEQYAAVGTTGVTNTSFAGLSQNIATSVYDAQFREYGIQGRWPSPDPAGIASANPANPQSWNRYAYVMNNPLAFADPSGLDCWSEVFEQQDSNGDETQSSSGCDDDLVDAESYAPFVYPNPGPLCLPGACSPQPSPTPPPPSQQCKNAVEAANRNPNAVNLANQNASIINAAAAQYGVNPALLSAIGVYESNFQNVSQPGGLGVGVFQIDLGQNGNISLTQAQNLPTAASAAASILSQGFNYFYNKGFSLVQSVIGSVRYYNAGPSGGISALTSGNFNAGTTGLDYVTNVLNIATNCFGFMP